MDSSILRFSEFVLPRIDSTPYCNRMRSGDKVGVGWEKSREKERQMDVVEVIESVGRTRGDVVSHRRGEIGV